MLRKRRVLTIVLVLTIVAIVGAMVLSACQIKLNNPPEDNDNVDTPKDEQGTTQEPEQDTTQHPEQDADTTPDVTPDPKPPIVEQKTEAEYKAMFEAELPGVIENYFNDNLAKLNFLKINDVKINTINNETGTIYINCVQQNVNKFMELNCASLKNATNYKTLSENVSKMSFTTENNKGVTVQTETLANEIAEFALEQVEVVNYLAENGIDASNYEVLNASNFQATSQGDISNLTIKFENKIMTMTIGGVTGACSTQEEYLNKLKDGRLSILTDFKIENYKELALA